MWALPAIGLSPSPSNMMIIIFTFEQTPKEALMNINNAIALVTGANRSIGVAFTRELLARGARKVYAGARDPSTVTQPGVEAIRHDVTKPEEVAAAPARAGGMTLIINNAGVGHQGGFLAADSEEVARRQFETN